MKTPRPPLPHGFTLVEAVIAAGLLGFLAVTATFFWVDGLGLARTVNYDTAAMADGRAVLERLTREIREVKYDSGGNAYCISRMEALRMEFNRTSGAYATGCGGATPTGPTNDIAVNVQFASGTTNLSLGYAGTLAAPAATRLLTSQASSFGIRYLDSAYAVTASAAAVRFVELSLTVQPPGQQATQSRTVVALRNN